MYRVKGSWRLAVVAALLLLLAAIGSQSEARPEYYDANCSPCHGGTRTCDGCHQHHGNISATPDQDQYDPGAPLVVTLFGGTRGGWIRGILYDENNQEITHVSGQEFPVDLPANAPDPPGEYQWNAAWFGNDGNGNHIEDWTPVTIRVVEIPSGIEEEGPSVLQKSWGRIKGFFRR